MDYPASHDLSKECVEEDKRKNYNNKTCPSNYILEKLMVEST